MTVAETLKTNKKTSEFGILFIASYPGSQKLKSNGVKLEIVKFKDVFLMAQSDYLNGQTAHVKVLINHQYDYRMRVGDWRICFNILEGIPNIISIEEVKKRDERTY